MGWAGLKQAFASCPEGGSVLVKEGEYAYGPGDMEPKAEVDGEVCAALQFSSSLHLFGHGKATLKPAANAPPFISWKIGPNKNAYCILSRSPYGTLDGLAIVAPHGTTDDTLTNGVGIVSGGLRLQSCSISAPKESGGNAVEVGGPATAPVIVGCRLCGGENTVQWSLGARGRLEGCEIRGAREFGFELFEPSTAPHVAGNTFRDCRLGIYVEGDVDSVWTPGEGNSFENMEEADLKDWR